jgi:hypothetical protein
MALPAWLQQAAQRLHGTHAACWAHFTLQVSGPRPHLQHERQQLSSRRVAVCAVSLNPLLKCCGAQWHARHEKHGRTAEIHGARWQPPYGHCDHARAPLEWALPLVPCCVTLAPWRRAGWHCCAAPRSLYGGRAWRRRVRAFEGAQLTHRPCSCILACHAPIPGPPDAPNSDRLCRLVGPCLVRFFEGAAAAASAPRAALGAAACGVSKRRRQAVQHMWV